jgi:hypothetical protein
MKNYLKKVVLNSHHINSLKVVNLVSPISDNSYLIKCLEVSVAHMILEDNNDAYDVMVHVLAVINNWYQKEVQPMEMSPELISEEKIYDMVTYLTVISNYFELTRFFTGINLWLWEINGFNLIKKSSIFAFQYFDKNEAWDYYSYVLFLIVSKESKYINSKFNPILMPSEFSKKIRKNNLLLPLNFK